MSAVTITLPKEFPLVLLAGAIICFECFAIGMAVVLPARMKTFTKEFMAQFTEEHKKAFPEGEPAVGGWPDAGDGRYSDKLPYKQWVEFNNAMRVHQNFVEMLPLILTFLVLGGLVLPKAAMYIGFINAAARIVYTIMYTKYGANSRALGAIAGSLPLYGLGIATLIQLLRLL